VTLWFGGEAYCAPFLSLHTQPVEMRFNGKALSVSSRSDTSTGVGILQGLRKSKDWWKRQERDE